MFVYDLIKKFAQRHGRDLTRYPIGHFLTRFEIDCVLDVGANVGQYAKHVRHLGYKGRIESFEPITEAYKQLYSTSRNDKSKSWNTHHFALGNSDEEREINISQHSPSSSFRTLAHNDHELDLTTAYTETVKVRRLEQVLPSLVTTNSNIYLKIDTQGYELEVLEGAGRALETIKLIQLEASLVEQYEKEPLIEDLLSYLRAKGFAPIWVVNGYTRKPNLQLLQADLILANEGLLHA